MAVCTRVVNRSRRVGYDVYVGRPSRWGNPCVIARSPGVLDGPKVVSSAGVACLVVPNLVEALYAYEAHLKANPKLVERARVELKGKVLGCWCTTDLSGKEPIICHAQILARIADGRTFPILPKRKA